MPMPSRQGTFILNDNGPVDDFPRIKEFFSANPNTSMDVRAHYQRDPGKTRIKFAGPLGAGSFGDVYAAELLFLTDKPGVFSWPCAAKRLRNYDGQGIPNEFGLHQEVTKAAHARRLSSVESGVLTMIGVHTETDANGNETYWGIYPKCDAMLASWVPAITELKETNLALYCHVVHTIFQGFVRGLATLSDVKIFHADIKPQNTCFRESGFVFLDFGVSQKYSDFFDENKTLAIGSPYFIAPEIPAKTSADATAEKEEKRRGLNPFAADVFGCGQIMLQLLGLEVSFMASNQFASFFRAGQTYTSKRKANPIDSIDEEGTVQKNLQNALSNAVDFVDFLTIITHAMSETLPENRPTLETLNYANELFSEFKQKIAIESHEIAAFYANAICGLATLPRQNDTTFESQPMLENHPFEPAPTDQAIMLGGAPVQEVALQEALSTPTQSSPLSSIAMQSDQPSTQSTPGRALRPSVHTGRDVFFPEHVDPMNGDRPTARLSPCPDGPSWFSSPTTHS